MYCLQMIAQMQRDGAIGYFTSDYKIYLSVLLQSRTLLQIPLIRESDREASEIFDTHNRFGKLFPVLDR
jgi:hypothetical protein